MRRPSATGRRAIRLAWAAVPFFALIIAFPGIFFSNGIFYLRDFHPFFFPLYSYLAESLGRLSLPLWLPHQGCGVPFLAALQPGVCYPPAMMAGLIGHGTLGLKMLVMGHLLLATLSMSLLARKRLGVTPATALTAGLGYGLGGFCISTISQLNNLQSAAWAPLLILLMLCATDGRLRKFRHRWLAAASFVLLMQLLAGGAEVTALTLLTAWILAVSGHGSHIRRETIDPVEENRFFRSPRSLVSRLVHSSTPILMVVLLALLLGAFQFLPTMEMAGRTARSGSGLSLEEVSRYSLEPVSLINLAFPRNMRSPRTTEYFRAFPGGRVPWLISIYPGCLILWLAIYGLVAGAGRAGSSGMRAERPVRFALGGLTLFGVLLALGDHLPGFDALFSSGLPGLGWFRYPEKLIFLPALTLPLLAALGMNSLIRRAGGRCLDSITSDRRLDPTASGHRSGPLAGALSTGFAPVSAIVMPLVPATAGLISLLVLSEMRGTMSLIFPLAVLAIALPAIWWAGRLSLGQSILSFLLLALVFADLTLAHLPLNDLVPSSFYAVEPQAVRLVKEDHQRHADSGGCGIPPRIRTGLRQLPGGPSVTERPAPTPYLKHLIWREYVTPNTASLYGISQFRGGTGMELDQLSRREQLLAGLEISEAVALLAIWNVTHLVLDRTLGTCGEVESLDDGNAIPGQHLFRVKRALPRAFLLPVTLWNRYRAVTGASGAQIPDGGILQEPSGGVQSLLDDLDNELHRASLSGESCCIIEYLPERVVLDVRTDRQSMMLHLSDSFDPGWHAWIDGIEVSIIETPCGFRALEFLEAGRFRVVMEYAPVRMRHGALAGLAVVMIFVTVCILRAFRRWKTA